MNKNNFRIYILTLLLCSGMMIPGISFAQYDMGGGIGVAAYSGDIVRRLDQGNIGLQGTLFGRRNFDNVWSMRAALSYGRISGADSITQIDASAIARDAYFKGNIFEVSAVMEYHFLDYTHPQAVYRYSPYGFFGLGYTYFSGSGSAYEFDPEENYGVGTPVIPFGIGVKYRLSEKWTLAAELGFRATFTDFLDKIDERQQAVNRIPDPANQTAPYRINGGNHTDKDWYYFFGLTISYSFNTIKCYTYN